MEVTSLMPASGTTVQVKLESSQPAGEAQPREVPSRQVKPRPVGTSMNQPQAALAGEAKSPPSAWKAMAPAAAATIFMVIGKPKQTLECLMSNCVPPDTNSCDTLRFHAARALFQAFFKKQVGSSACEERGSSMLRQCPACSHQTGRMLLCRVPQKKQQKSLHP